MIRFAGMPEDTSEPHPSQLTFLDATGLALYQPYDRADVIARAASGAEPRTLCEGQWVVLPDVVLCFVTVGPGPDTSFFTAASRFRWIAEKPYRVADDPDPHLAFLPAEVRGGKDPGRPIFLFAHPTAAGPFTFAGRLRPSYAYGYSTCDAHGHADFDLWPTLPSDVWRALRGRLRPRPTPEENAVLRAALTEPPTAPVAHRLATLDLLIDYWHGPFSPEDAYRDSELEGRPIAEPLRWWYRRGGHRKGILDGFNRLIPPDELELDEHGRVMFLAECQGVYFWSTLPAGEDPPIWGSFNEDDDPWEKEEPTLSSFLIQSCIFEALNAAPYGAEAAWIDQPTLDAVTAPCSLIPLGAWRWAAYPSRFWVGDGLFVYATPNDDEPEPRHYSLYVGALTEHPLAYIKPLVTPRWEYMAL